MPYPLHKRGSAAHLQHLAGIAWKEGDVEEATRLEALATQAEIEEAKGKPVLSRPYGWFNVITKGHVLDPLDELS